MKFRSRLGTIIVCVIIIIIWLRKEGRGLLLGGGGGGEAADKKSALVRGEKYGFPKAKKNYFKQDVNIEFTLKLSFKR